MKALALLLIASAAHAGPTAYGLPLGEPVHFQECPYTQAGPTRWYKQADEPCLRPPPEGGPATQETPNVMLYFPTPIAGGAGGFALPLVVDGRLELLAVPTSGQDVVGTLRARYGEPTEQRVSEVQNRYGARSDVVRARWEREGVRVDFSGASGTLLIGTPKGFAERERRFQERQRANPVLQP